jgi:adenosylcobyric acid synthase
MGVSEGAALARPALSLRHGPEGALSEDSQVLGTYVHGLFDSPAACQALLAWAGLATQTAPDYPSLREAAFERLADAVENHLNIIAIERILGLPSAVVVRPVTPRNALAAYAALEKGR